MECMSEVSERAWRVEDKNIELNDIVSRLELELQQEKLLQAENDNNDILVDVIVPVYGGLQETQECIESAISTSLMGWINCY